MINLISESGRGAISADHCSNFPLRSDGFYFIFVFIYPDNMLPIISKFMLLQDLQAGFAQV